MKLKRIPASRYDGAYYEAVADVQNEDCRMSVAVTIMDKREYKVKVKHPWEERWDWEVQACFEVQHHEHELPSPITDLEIEHKLDVAGCQPTKRACVIEVDAALWRFRSAVREGLLSTDWTPMAVVNDALKEVGAYPEKENADT